MTSHVHIYNQDSLKVLEAAFGSDELEVNFSNPKFKFDFNEWKSHDKSVKGLSDIISKYKKVKD